MALTTLTEPVWTTLFNRRAFHGLDGSATWAWTGTDPGDGREVGRLAGVVDADGVLVCGWSAPFGGLDLARDHEPPARVEALVAGALGAARADGLAGVRIRCRPPCWSAAEPTIAFALLNAGLNVVRAELNQHLDVPADPAAYVAGLRSPARRALRHLGDEEDAWAFGPAPDPDAAHALLAANRAARGRRLALDAAYVARAREALGEDVVRLAELRHHGRPVAAALTYRVTPRRELVVAWGDHGHGLARSPMNLLALRLVERAAAEGVVLLDLGISNVPGEDGALVADPGLAQFKRSVGAVETVRTVLEVRW